MLEVTGLDDEWAGNCEIQVFVNGTGVYQGPSPWLSYSGNASDFSDAQWSTASLSIPAEMLRAGDNTIEIHNLEPAANFGSPPYILLAETTLRVFPDRLIEIKGRRRWGFARTMRCCPESPSSSSVRAARLTRVSPLRR